jgi:hypothetical protein
MRGKKAADVEIFRALVELYNQQPTLGVRTSTSVAQQAYSTPVPLAFLASKIAGIDGQTTVYEPTAGNGMLLIEALPAKAEVNELNPDRAEALRSQGFSVTEKDAASFVPARKVDRVIANPPFGRVKDSHGQAQVWNTGEYDTPEIDHAIVFNALDAMKRDGKAVLIIGSKRGDEKTRREKYRSSTQTQFYEQLFDNYIVLDHFSVDGKLYSRQGAAYPIDIIVIGGKGRTENPKFPGAVLPRIYNSFEELEGVLDNEYMVDTARVLPGDDSGSSGRVERDDTGRRGNEIPDRLEGEQTARLGQGKEKSEIDQGGAETSGGLRTDLPGSGRENGTVNRSGSVRTDEFSSEQVRGERGLEVSPEGGRRGTGRGPANVSGLGTGGDIRTGGLVTKQKDTQYQTAYNPASRAEPMGTLVPKNMVTAVENALKRVEAVHGPVDEYVAKELGYGNREEIHRHFGAEQIDAIALALHNIANGDGFIIGDQTGIGKGRVNAAVIRWARRQGKIPVFITVNPVLYSAMVEDLADIGMPGAKPLVTNAGLSGENAIALKDGRTIATRSAPKHNALLASVAVNGLGDYDV